MSIKKQTKKSRRVVKAAKGPGDKSKVNAKASGKAFGSKAPLSEEDIKRIRAKKRREQKKRALRRRRMLALIILVIIVAGLSFIIPKIAGLFSGLGFKESDVSTLTIESDGSVIFEEVTELSEDYDTGKLKSFAKRAVKDFEPAEGESVHLDKVRVNSGVCYVRTEFSSVACYKSFTGYDAFYGTIAEADKAGYKFTTSFYEAIESEDSEGNVVVKTKSAERDAVTKAKDAKVFVLRENVRIRTKEPFVYVSTEGTEVDYKSVTVKPLDGNYDSAPLCYIVFPKDEDTGKE